MEQCTQAIEVWEYFPVILFVEHVDAPEVSILVLHVFARSYEKSIGVISFKSGRFDH